METIQITPDLRLVIMPDTDAESPLEWGWAEEDVQDALESWENGEVYGVILEKRETYTNGDKSIDVWEEVDAIWGNYLTDGYTAQDVAAEHFSEFPQNYR